MGDPVLKNWKPKKVVKFLKANGFTAFPSKGKGDHCKMTAEKPPRMVIVDMGHRSFTAREMLTLSKESGIDRSKWLEAK